MQLSESLFHNRTRAGGVDPLKSRALRAEHAASVQPQTGVLCDEALQFLVAETETAHVEPQEVCAFRVDQADFRNVFSEVRRRKVHIAANIIPDFLKPRQSAFVGGAAGGESHDVDCGSADVGDRLSETAAQIIVSQHGGELPADAEQLRALPGIGDYTSGAIAAIAFGIPVPAVDGNVERVICRYFAIRDEMGSPAARKRIQQQTQALVPPDRPGAFANAMMEMGAVMCTPKSPACLLCPVRENCKGHARGIAANLPVKPRKKAQRIEMRCVMLVFCQNRVLTVLRKERLLGGLSVFPDAAGELSPSQMCAALSQLGVSAAYDARLGHARHVFTHLIWEMEIHAFAAESLADVPDGRWVSADELAALPMPTAVKAARRFAADTLTRANA